jgi:predicted GNAT family acetyltransferase
MGHKNSETRQKSREIQVTTLDHTIVIDKMRGYGVGQFEATVQYKS